MSDEKDALGNPVEQDKPIEKIDADYGRINLLLDVMTKAAPANFPTLSGIVGAAGRELQGLNDKIVKDWAKKVAEAKAIADKKAAEEQAKKDTEAARVIAQAKADQDAADAKARAAVPLVKQQPTQELLPVGSNQPPSPSATDRGAV